MTYAEKWNFIECSGAVGARLSTDASIVRTLVGDALALIVQNMATAIGGLVIAFTANWILAIIILLVLPLICLQGFFLAKLNESYSADAKVLARFCFFTNKLLLSGWTILKRVLLIFSGDI